MTGVRDNALTQLLGWPQGLDNLSAETELPMGKKGPGGNVFGSLRVAENVDIDESGKVSRRRGYTLVEALTGLHSLWTDKRYPFALAVHGTNLVKYDTNLARTTVVALTAGARMSFDFDAGYVYYTNGFDSGRIDFDGVREPWALQPPIGQPLLEANAAGGLSAGLYQVAVTYRDNSGRESGTTMAADIEITEGQGIRLLSIPQPTEATWIRVYVTETNGEVLRFCQDTPVGTTTFLVGAQQLGAPLATQWHEPLPAGQIVRLYRGRMYVFRHNVLYWSEAMHYGQGVLHRNYLHMDSDGTLIEGQHLNDEAGLFVAAGKRTYYFSGADPAKWTRSIAHAHGAVIGSSTQIEPSVLEQEGSGTMPLWFDTAGGMVTGGAGGRVTALHDERFVGPINVESAATLIREKDGLQQILTTIRGGAPNPLGVSDRAEAEVWKDGVRLS